MTINLAAVKPEMDSTPVVTYPLSMARDYIRHWGLPEAIREFLQNAIDSDSPFEFAFNHEELIITSRKSSLDPSTLLLGATSKAEKSDKIGNFGEGYKLALLVLTRLGLHVCVENNGRLWKPVFRFNEQFDLDMLYVDEYPSHCTGLSFVVGGLTEADKEMIVDQCLHMQEKDDDAIEAHQGRILPSRPGKLFVNGLFVCDTGLKYGYDVKPDYLKLERDRQTVSSFELKWLAKDMWFDTKQFEHVAKMITDRVPDLEYAEHGCPELLKEAVFAEFTARNPGNVIASSPEHLKELVARGITKTVYIDRTTHSIVSSSRSYKESSLAKAAAKPLPFEDLEKYLESNKKHMRRAAIVAFAGLLALAKGWQNK